jgi:OmpA-OmpF porin, OOP family
VPGVASAAGCPDRDGDSVADADDKCPDAPGLPALMGCADRDADGVADPDDACPDAKGLAAFAGCPDTDSDGLADNKDNCPKEAGPASNQGCPVKIADRDADGVPDAADACPDVKGTAAAKGCPDRDGDNIADRDDACPDKPGTAVGKGCPDSDGDGVYDNDDRCPDKAGTLANKGCPEIKAEDKAKLERAIKLVQFESGKAVLLQKSNAVLDEVVSVMKTYPEYSLNIGGHTDNQGDDKMNKTLSERRAKACYDYLANKGVAAARMTHQGFGETQPVAENTTPAGREKNRRVEFELFVK